MSSKLRGRPSDATRALRRWLRPRAVFVETAIRSPMDEIWRHTQTPELHARWDLRFSVITMQAASDEAPDPVDDAARPMRFQYATRLWKGRAIQGWGTWTTAGDRRDGSRVSSLRFGTDDPLSLIREGSGYWRYVPADGGVRFLTAYDYQTRLGVLGRVVDRVAFRPAIGWATAWSFDRLRRWLEDGIEPERALRAAVLHGVARGGLAAILAWHGLVPKVLMRAADERLMLRSLGVPGAAVVPMVVMLGVAETGLAGWLLVRWHDGRPAAAAACIGLSGIVATAIGAPRLIGAAFGPVSLGIATGCLALIDGLTLADLPSADRCRRRPGGIGE